MYCSKCNKEIDNDSAICAYCGTEVVKKGMPYYNPIFYSSRTQVFLSMFRAQGRNSRSLHLTIFAIYFILLLITAFVENNLSDFLQWYALLVFLPSYIYICSVIKRLHDMDVNGISALWLLLPVLNVVIIFRLIFIKGTQEKNKYGDKSLYLRDFIKGPK